MNVLLLSTDKVTKSAGFGMEVLYFVLFVVLCCIIWYIALWLFRIINKISKK